MSLFGVSRETYIGAAKLTLTATAVAIGLEELASMIHVKTGTALDQGTRALAAEHRKPVWTTLLTVGLPVFMASAYFMSQRRGVFAG